MMIILGYLFMALPFMVMIMLGIAAPLLILLMYLRFGAGLVAITGMFIIEALYMQVSGLNVGISLYYTDIVLAFVGFVALLRFIGSDQFPHRHKAWVLFCTLIAVSFILGLATNGSMAGVQARPYIYFVAAGLYAMSFPVDERRLRLVMNAFAISAIIMLLLSVYRWIVFYTPIYDLLPEEGVYNVDGPMRVIPSNDALVIAQVVVVGLFFARISWLYSLARFASPVLLAATLALQHRSVWLAALVGVCLAFLLQRANRASWGSQAVLLVVVVLTAVAPMVLSDRLSTVSTEVESSSERLLAGTDTTAARAGTWKSALGTWATSNPKQFLIGNTFGGDTTRYIEDERTGAFKKITHAVHNMYIQTLVDTGLVGLICWIAVITYVIRNLYRLARDGAGIEAEALLIMIAMQAAYYVPYGTDYLQNVLFGVAVAYVACKTQKHRRTSPFSIAGGRPAIEVAR